MPSGHEIIDSCAVCSLFVFGCDVKPPRADYDIRSTFAVTTITFMNLRCILFETYRIDNNGGKKIWRMHDSDFTTFEWFAKHLYDSIFERNIYLQHIIPSLLRAQPNSKKSVPFRKFCMLSNEWDHLNIYIYIYTFQ